MREKIEMKTHTLGVALSAAWPMVLATVLLVAMVLVLFPVAQGWPIIALIVGVVGLTFLWCFRMYLGTYLFLPPTEFKGARIIARLGRQDETEISSVLASEIIIKQGWLEKLCGVCHIRQKGTAVYLRGVREPEKVKAWIAANFPMERKAPEPKGKKNRKK